LQELVVFNSQVLKRLETIEISHSTPRQFLMTDSTIYRFPQLKSSHYSQFIPSLPLTERLRTIVLMAVKTNWFCFPHICKKEKVLS